MTNPSDRTIKLTLALARKCDGICWEVDLRPTVRNFAGGGAIINVIMVPNRIYQLFQTLLVKFLRVKIISLSLSLFHSLLTCLSDFDFVSFVT